MWSNLSTTTPHHLTNLFMHIPPYQIFLSVWRSAQIFLFDHYCVCCYCVLMMCCAVSNCLILSQTISHSCHKLTMMSSQPSSQIWNIFLHWHMMHGNKPRPVKSLFILVRTWGQSVKRIMQPTDFAKWSNCLTLFCTSLSPPCSPLSPCHLTIPGWSAVWLADYSQHRAWAEASLHALSMWISHVSADGDKNGAGQDQKFWPAVG